MSKKDEQKMKEMQQEIDEAEAEETAADEAEAPETAEASESDAAEADAAAEAEAPDEDAAALKAQVESLKAALEEKDNRVKRLQADFENFRRRTSKEREELANVVTQDLLKSMLPILDNFDRAMAAEQKDNESFQKGVEMIYTQLHETLKNAGLELIDTAGQKFDPNFHQAVMRVENPDLEDDTIAQELQKGYIVKGRVIRPSMVQVVSN
ncbi:nucleotide exchange factor GrpE [Selenomonas bovis]|uniref:nucleotide exchange factor GrpE n=1 Tax=Selenomonas bovis TaxID=416586 RepID=UPI001E494B60|nr:nucleotide exchange factor GrpE [Selenomonas bovis]MCI6753054.1 nucleotide exchange factor GrpE [Selenomonas bovis]